jgi:hypothetical protein
MRSSVAGMVVAALLVLARPEAGTRLQMRAPGERVSLHAHNCYPERGLWTDRIERALGTTPRPLVIEQDLVWRAADRQSVVAHDTEPASTQSAPTLEDYFFKRVAPILDGSPVEGRRPVWPIVILHLDFKTYEPEHYAEVWRLLGKYERWLTMAERAMDAARVVPLTPGPLLVLTENRPGAEEAFHDRLAAGEPLRVFGTVPPTPAPPGREKEKIPPSSIPVDVLIPAGATNYRRWTNHSWAAVEAGGPPEAGEWTPGDRVRLEEIVRRAHDVGLWVRFYTLNGHTVNENHGWTASYNFGSLDAARIRWRAAIEAGVDFVATDQYEEFARELQSRIQNR